MKRSNMRLIPCVLSMAFLGVLAVSCGNPHLIIDKTKIATSVSPVQTPDVANEKARELLTVNDINLNERVDFGKIPNNLELTKAVEITSKDPGQIPLTAVFEKGEHFSFAGGKFPGLKGTCTETIENLNSCKLDILFDPNAIGKFEDNLIITTKNGLVFTIPLIGERTSVIAPPEQSPLVFGGSGGLPGADQSAEKNPIDEVNFGGVKLGDSAKKIMTLNNPSDKEIKISTFELPKDSDFSIVNNSACEKNIMPGECKIELSYRPKEQAKVSDSLLVIKDSKGKQLVIHLKGKGLEKTPNIQVVLENDKTIGLSIPNTNPGKNTGANPSVLADNQLNENADKGGVDKTNNKIIIINNKERVVEKIVYVDRPGKETVKEITVPVETIVEKIVYVDRPGKETVKEIKVPVETIVEKIVYITKEAKALPPQLDSLNDMNFSNEEVKAIEITNDLVSPSPLTEISKSEVKMCTDTAEVSLNMLPKIKVDLKSIILPYHDKMPKTKKVLKRLYGTEFNAKIKNSDVNTVKDAQVISTFAPFSQVNAQIEDILLKVDIIKVETKDNNDTELLCVSSEHLKKCSGRLFKLQDWMKLYNTQFFKSFKSPVSPTYEQVLSGTVKKCGDLNCEMMEKTLSLKSLLNLTNEEMEILKNEKSVHIILTDDSRQLSEPVLIFKTKETKECSK